MQKSNILSRAVIMLCCIATALTLSGCFDNSRQALSGSVTVDGQPINGSISFDPTAGTTGPSTGGAIRDGKFSMDRSIGLLPGKYTVSIQTSQKTGRMINDNGLRVAEMLPVRFREADSLEAAIVAGAENKFEYELTSIRKLQN